MAGWRQLPHNLPLRKMKTAAGWKPFSSLRLSTAYQRQRILSPGLGAFLNELQTRGRVES